MFEKIKLLLNFVLFQEFENKIEITKNNTIIEIAFKFKISLRLAHKSFLPTNTT